MSHTSSGKQPNPVTYPNSLRAPHSFRKHHRHQFLLDPVRFPSDQNAKCGVLGTVPWVFRMCQDSFRAEISTL